jgi:hypothetical protein
VNGLYVRLADGLGPLGEASVGAGSLGERSLAAWNQALAAARSTPGGGPRLAGRLHAQWWVLIGRELVEECSAEACPIGRWQPAGSVSWPEEDRLTAAAATGLVGGAAGRLLAGQGADGWYLYRYDPVTDRGSAGPGSVIRQAGTAAAMARYARLAATATTTTAAPRWAEADRAARSAAAAVRALIGHASRDSSGCLRITSDPVSDEPGTLGALALTLLAIQYLPPGSAPPEVVAELTDSILRSQRADGSFACWTDGSTREEASKQAYYPGEALLALIRQDGPDADACAAAVSRAFGWYESYFRRSPSSAFASWHAVAWATSAGRPGAPPELLDRQASFVMELADWLLRFQLPGRGYPYGGGFAVHGPEPGCTTASYVEAIVHACAIARLSGDQAMARRYRRAARQAFTFLSRLIITPEQAASYRRPELAAGGTKSSLRAAGLRCDNDQHTMTALMSALDDGEILWSSPGQDGGQVLAYGGGGEQSARVADQGVEAEAVLVPAGQPLRAVAAGTGYPQARAGRPGSIG